MQRKLSLHLFSIHKTAGFTWKGQCPKMLENLPFAMAKLPFAMAKLPTTAAHNKILHNEHIKAQMVQCDSCCLGVHLSNACQG